MQVSARDEEGAYERMKFLKLAWDAVGSEFASRHVQYEMFYAGAEYVAHGHSYRTYDWERAQALVDQMIDTTPGGSTPRRSTGGPTDDGGSS